MDKSLWSKRIGNVEPYVAGEQPKDKRYIKLNTNESPYPPSARALEAARTAASGDLRLYPDPEGAELKAALADCFGLGPEQIFVGNGSDEILAFSFIAFFDAGGPAAYADVTYSFYPVYSQILGLRPRVLMLDEDFAQPVEEYCGCKCGVVLANPNAPTGIALPLEAIERIVSADPARVVIVDEAYVDFGAESAAGLVSKYPNLLVVQTFSKSRALAGMRVGFALGSESLIAALRTVRDSINSYTLDRVALAASAEAVRDTEYFDELCGRITSTRRWVTARLMELGFRVTDSKTNFLFITHPEKPAAELFSELRDRGVLVRHFNKPRIENYLRVTIGSDDEMTIFCAVMKLLLEGETEDEI